jgi:hypothetical protein
MCCIFSFFVNFFLTAVFNLGHQTGIWSLNLSKKPGSASGSGS